jgi:hypothetical protein
VSGSKNISPNHDLSSIKVARIANEYNRGYCKFFNGIGYVKEIIVPLNDKEIEEIIKDYNEFNSNFKKID